VLPALFSLLLLLVALPALAHNLSVAHVSVVRDVGDRRLATVEVDLSLKDLALTIPLDANHDEAVTWAELRAARPSIEALVARGVALDAMGGPCALQPTGLGTRRYDDGSYATLLLRARCPSAGSLRVRYTLFFDRDPQHRAVVSLSDGTGTAAAIANAGTPTGRLDGKADDVFAEFVREGVHHILIGYDHLAFLISLVLPALLAWLGGVWRADPDMRRRLRDVFWLVTAFTLAHSVTLTLAALDLVRPASRIIEPAIAASVLLAALNNIRPVVVRRLWLLSFGFGLVHGFGFAGALGEIGLPKGGRVLALLGFNVGVELGQLSVLCVLLPVLYLVRNRPGYGRRVVPLVSLGIALRAGAWLVQRLSG
jgi:hypothetical protein